MTTAQASATVVKRSMLNTICHGILGFIYAIVVYLLPASIVASLVSEIRSAALMKASIVIQLAVGFLFSVVAYVTAWNRPIKIGMRTCYGLLVGFIVATGAYTILTSI